MFLQPTSGGEDDRDTVNSGRIDDVRSCASALQDLILKRNQITCRCIELMRHPTSGASGEYESAAKLSRSQVLSIFGLAGDDAGDDPPSDSCSSS